MILNTDLIYPVGSIYMNATNPTDPSILFGGTWKKISYRYLIGEGAIEKNTSNGFGSVDAQADAGWTIGGAGATFGEILHKLTESEMPSHTHGIYGALTGKTEGIYNYGNDWAVDTSRYWNRNANTNTGGNQDHNNMPPSLCVYMWQRIA